jgi:hypothetical protein
MGRMAYLSERHWRQHLPTAYATISDTAAFFQELEDEAAHQVDDLMESLAGPEPAGETYIEKVGRYRMARLQAEEIVFPEVLMPTPEEAPEDRAADRTADAELAAALTEFRDLVNELGARSTPE